MAAASAAGGRGAALAPQSQGPQGEPTRGAGGTWPWDRDWGAVLHPLGDETLPLARCAQILHKSPKPRQNWDAAGGKSQSRQFLDG